MIQENIRISVIVAAYNIEEYLVRCLDSICNQTYHNLEILVVDDGSTDETGRICEEYAGKRPRQRSSIRIMWGFPGQEIPR